VNFLCIGAQKAGTSWLWANLRQHPHVWLPPLKELHYFDRPDDGLWERFTHPRTAYRDARRELIRGTLGLRWLSGGADELRWYARYLLGHRSDAWYRSLFSPAAGRTSGEITPRYSVLPDSAVAHAARILPDAHIVYLIRNPMERAWSNLKMGADRYGAVESWNGEDLRERVLRRSGVIAMGRYLENLERWERHFPSERILVGFFDEILDDPEHLLRRVYRFLEIDDAEHHLPTGLRARVNPGPPDPIPGKLRRVLAEIYRGEVAALHERFASPYTKAWIEAIDAS
jgi:hypothetical protein